MRWIFLIFIVIPVVEMLVLIEVGIRLGSVFTVALIFFNMIFGIIILRRQGIKTLLNFNQKLNQGELPAQEVLSAVFLALAGLLLIVPGLVSDLVGFLLLLPLVRRLLADYLIKQGMLKAVNSFQKTQFYQYFEDFSSGNEQYDNAQDDIDYAVFKAKKAAEKNARASESSEFKLIESSSKENLSSPIQQDADSSSEQATGLINSDQDPKTSSEKKE